MLTPSLRKMFEDRIESILKLIDEYRIEYEAILLFGSVAREECKNTSDVDICVVIREQPEQHLRAELREDADALGADIVFTTKEQLKYSDSLLYRNIRRDYKVLRGEFDEE